MFNKMVVKRAVCLLVMLAAVSSTLSAQRVWKPGEIAPLQGVFPSVGDYMGPVQDGSYFQVVVMDFYEGGIFHLVLTHADVDSYGIEVCTNDSFLLDLMESLPSDPNKFNPVLNFEAQRIMEKLTGGYRPFSVVGDSGNSFFSVAGAVTWESYLHGFSREELHAGRGAFTLVFSGSSDWYMERNPTILNRDGKTRFYTPYKGQ